MPDTHICPKCQAVVQCVEIETADSDELTKIAAYYHEYVHKIMIKGGKPYMSAKAKAHLKRRIKEFGVDKMYVAMRKFAADPWRMKNNSHYGIEWFFRSEDQVIKWLALDGEIDDGQSGWQIGSKTYNSSEEIKAAEARGEIYYGPNGYQETGK